LCKHVDDASVKVKVFLVEYVFLVEVLLSYFFLVKFGVFDIGNLSGITSRLELVIELVDLFRVQVRNVLFILLLLWAVTILVLNSKPEVVELFFPLLHKPVLFLSTTRSSYLISFSPARARYQL
jgi:hypothetical protein